MEFLIDWQYGCYTGHLSFGVGSGNWLLNDEEILDNQSYWLFEGNFSCDCNRSLITPDFNWETGEIGDTRGCGSEIVFLRVEFYQEGRYIGHGSDSGWYESGDDLSKYVRG